MLQTEPARAFYGKKHVQYAAKSQAIDTLLISDTLFRSQDIATRKEYVELVESVKENSGVVKLFSSMHASGERESLIFTNKILQIVITDS